MVYLLWAHEGVEDSTDTTHVHAVGHGQLFHRLLAKDIVAPECAR
ncbi:MAG: hypothetical protein UY95_C0010G0008 [Parcubacteria group bacterium GW2011_GWA2_56_7]|nr:MAG: hypothetical protein UY95_C0010G0008 [Parcubacteria group bacterium GW2011_GWA2_56_7]